MKLHKKQTEALKIINSDATYAMLFGGSRSGKTFLLVRQIIVRALKAPKSRHAILRFRFNQVKNTIVYDTFPKVMKLAFPNVQYKVNKTDWFVTLPNGSEIWFGGLDDKERTEKILGMEFATIYLNECSQIPYPSVGIAITRLAQKVEQIIEGKPPTLLKPRMYFDCNPPNKNHWTYSLFIQHKDVDTKLPINNEFDYVHFQINPYDNKENLSDGYLETLGNLSARLRKRFLEGEFADANPNQLFKEEDIDKWRVEDERLPDFVRVLVGIDPSGSGDTDNADNDAIGIIVGALGVDGNAYLLEDCTVKAGPATWGKVAASAFERHKADLILAESNFGGAMVEQVIQSARPRTPYKAVSASRGKVIRAEPFALLYEQGKIRHCGRFIDLEDEMAGFSTQGYIGNASPNRMDAWIWVLTELFPGMVRERVEKKLQQPIRRPMLTRNGNYGGTWM